MFVIDSNLVSWGTENILCTDIFSFKLTTIVNTQAVCMLPLHTFKNNVHASSLWWNVV